LTEKSNVSLPLLRDHQASTWEQKDLTEMPVSGITSESLYYFSSHYEKLIF